jgi:small GTP-binding protein
LTERKTPFLQKKICMLGAFAVGKTSLVERFVEGTYRDRYLTTVGVKVSRRDVDLPQRTVRLLLWDLHGEDAFQRVQPSYLRGASGVFLVIDGTRRKTLDTACDLAALVERTVGEVPALWLLNKIDLRDEVEVDLEEVAARTSATVLPTSALTGEGVDDAFHRLARAMTDR